jgi:hypothetical protein
MPGMLQQLAANAIPYKNAYPLASAPTPFIPCTGNTQLVEKCFKTWEQTHKLLPLSPFNNYHHIIPLQFILQDACLATAEDIDVPIQES